MDNRSMNRRWEKTKYILDKSCIEIYDSMN